LEFEFPIGTLEPGQCFETKDFVYMCDVFGNVMDFRNYVRGEWETEAPHVRNHLEVAVNGHNPVVTAKELPLTVHNNRQKVWEGEITVSSPDGLFAEQQQTNPEETMVEANGFTLPIEGGQSGIAVASVHFRLKAFEKDVSRALLVTGNAKVETCDNGGLLTVNNGALRFSASAAYSDALVSMRYNGHEWLFSNYPEPKPYSWWNPFVGGIYTIPDKISHSQVLREKITASFAEVTDALGNAWTGLQTEVSVSEADEYKGMRYTQYYLTLPGVPVLCHFARIQNDTGRFLSTGADSDAFLADKERLNGLYASVMAKDKQSYRLKMGAEEHWMTFDRLAAITRENIAETLYVYSDAARTGGESNIEANINICNCGLTSKIRAADGQSVTTRPLFCLLSDKALTADMLTDLDRVVF
jgi:hypothetical protein